MNAVTKIYGSYFQTKKDNLYYNEIKELSNLSDSSLSRALKKLKNSKILLQEKTKSNTFYKIKDKKIFELEFSKIANKKFQELNIGVKVPLKNFLKQIPNNIFTIVLFGSSSIKEEQEGSDIDVLVVSNEKINLEEIKTKVDITSNYPISIFNCNIKQFNFNSDNIIIQAKKTGFPIYKEQNFYEVILNEYK